MNDNAPSSAASRRDFLRIAGQAGAAATAFGAMAMPRSVHAAGSDTLRVGLVGCGGRGAGAVIDALSADKNAQLVAIGDTFADRAQAALEQFKGAKQVADRVVVSPDHVFSGFDAYKNVIDNVDVVLLATPPHFRPEHLRYAVEKGKHSFVEKPIAVDVPGVQHVMETCRLAKEKNLAVVSGLCWRYDLGVRETMRQILEEKAIGDVIAIESSYNANGLWHRGDDPSWSRMEYQIRNWLYFTWLSGDHILEQAVHSLDKTAWLLGDIQPLKAMALGGRQQRVDPKYGNIYDHFAVFYEYPDGRHVYFTCRQQDNCSVRVDERVLGTAGQAEILKHELTDRGGKRTWRYKGDKPSMYQQEHDELFASIRKGEPINNGHYMCNSTMIGLLGRAAGYTGQTVTWDQLQQSTERLGPSQYAWGEAPDLSVAIPGKTTLQVG
ncbi:MAG: Gfo/Idh/MocA family oxidoreductase [Pirellulales bacterium]|nr:Gfo/Idh/MocA family oxidoreductase [Pirellulales bacterium]